MTDSALIYHACRNKRRQLFQDQSPVLSGADILNNPRNNYYGTCRSSNYPRRIQLSPKHQSGEFRCPWEVKLYNSIIFVVHVCKQWPMKRHVSRWKTAPISTLVSTFWWSIILGVLDLILSRVISREVWQILHLHYIVYAEWPFLACLRGWSPPLQSLY